MNLKKYIRLTIFLVPLVLGITLLANSSNETIRVTLTHPYNLLLNNRQILQDQPTLFYNNVLYVPAKDFAKELGYTVEYDNSTAVITNTEIPKPSSKTTSSPKQSISTYFRSSLRPLLPWTPSVLAF